MAEPAGATFILKGDESGERVDRFIADALDDLSRTAVQRLIEAEQITVNGEAPKASYNVAPEDEIVVHVPPPEPTHIQPQALPLAVLYEDHDIIVVNKAAGRVVHPGAGHPDGTLVNALLAHCPDLQGVGGKLRPGIVHRLDRDTSGVLVVAKNDKAIRRLQRQFRYRRVSKHYVALLIGNLERADGFIDAPIGRHPRHRKKMAVIVDGKRSRTRWRVRNRWLDARGHWYTLVDVRPLSGRTHQIRVHFSWLGFPLVGDPVYGPRHGPLDAPRHFLHARDLTFVHPRTQEEMTFEAPLPEDLQGVLDGLRKYEE